MTNPYRQQPPENTTANTSAAKVYTASPTLTRLHESRKVVKYVEGPVNCLPADTEYLSPEGWRRMDSYQEGEKVAQWNEGQLEYVVPGAYVVSPCEDFLQFKNTRALHMVVSDEHRVPLYNWNGQWVVKTAAQLALKPSRHIVPTTFKAAGPGIALAECELRLAVALMADGCYPADNPKSTARHDYCIVTVRKERKKIRLEYLLASNFIEYTRAEHSTREGETTFRFRWRYGNGKRFTADWWQCSPAQLETALEECLLWDGHDGKQRTFYCSRHEGDADFIQYAAHACGWRGSKTCKPPRAGKEHWSDIYVVELARPTSAKSVVMFRGDNLDISRVPAEDGKKYCFSVPSTFFLVRHSGCVFVTGNSGKSTGCILEVIMRGLRQAPDANKVRKSRWAIVRNSYPELKSTTIKSWEMWVPPHVAPVVYSSPIQCNFKQNLADGTRMEMEVIFLAMDHPDDAARVLSMELTGVYINEGKEIGWELFEAIKGRTDRYPQFEILDDGTEVGGASEPGMVVDSNPPHISHWLYEKFETGAVPDGWEKFQQPPAVYWDEEQQTWLLNPDRENQRFTKPDYYPNQLKGAEETYIRVMLAGEYGASRKGRPIFARYQGQKHVAKTKLEPDRQWPLIVGLDFGLTPGCVIGQLTRRGIRVTDEIPTSDVSLEDFLETYLVPLLAKRYPGWPVTVAGDPAGRGRSANDKRTSFDVLGQFGLKGFPAYTNSFQVRKDTVDHFLGRDEGLIISPHCTYLREALSTGYVWKESRNNKGASLDVADKNEFSHIADALQYLCLWAKYGYRPQPVREHGPKKKTMMV